MAVFQQGAPFGMSAGRVDILQVSWKGIENAGTKMT